LQEVLKQVVLVVLEVEVLVLLVLIVHQTVEVLVDQE
tara:strand:- start:137 stop:247 length:111 start_codon:yes stop_codon:yes gene_type:complete